MKRKTVITVFFSFFLLNWALSQSLQVSFTTVPITSGSAAKYNPKHILAVWVETSDGTFVSSLKVMAKKRIGNLTNWNATSLGDKVNAVTGATLASHTSHSVTWNCKKYNGTAISDGDYKLCIELTSGDATGTYSESPFTISSNSLTFTQNGSNINNLSLSYTPGNTSQVGKSILQDVVSVMPNPFIEQTTISFYTNSSAPYTIDVINLAGQKVYSIKGNSILGENECTLNAMSQNFPAGNYYCVIKTKDYITSEKIIKK